VKEAGRTLHENSLAKALYAYQISGLPSLADDSGLFINALDGEPGVFSARYGRTDEQRIQRVLQNLREQHDRRAVFRAVFVLVTNTSAHQIFEGICQGSITSEPRGDHGFGYDPIFIPDGYNETFAELGPDVKNTISHRSLALEKVKAYLSL
jgi:XTP/dITP diphosphohydrolase